MGDSRTEFKLKTPPEDGITRVTFSPSSPQLLLASSWDKTVRIYDISSNIQRVAYTHSMPVLDCAFKDQVRVLSGGLDNTIKTFDINSQQERVVGRHENAIKCVEFSNDMNLIVTGSWDGTVKVWDDRAQYPQVGTHTQPDKVYTMDMVGKVLMVGTAGRKVWVWDLRNMASPLQKRESSLKYQTRCLACFPNKTGYVMSSIEGRVAVEYLDQVESQLKKYAFKCHRVKENGIENIYPVNAVSFHKEHNTFATGGSDGYVNIWDGSNKKRLCQFHRYPTSIASIAFSIDGSVLAIASSYMYENNSKPDNIPQDSIFIRIVSDQETKPK